MREIVVDLRRVLRSKAKTPAGAAVPSAALPVRSSRVPLAAVLILAAVGIAAIGGWLWMADAPSKGASGIHQQRLTDSAGMEETPAVSPDGKSVAFVASVDGRRQIFARLLAKGAPIQITRENSDHSFPRWVDENTLIYFLHPDKEGAPGSLWEKVVLSSDSPRRIGPSQGEADVSRDTRKIATFRTDAEGPALVIIERDGKSRRHRETPSRAASTAGPAGRRTVAVSPSRFVMI